VGNMSGKAQTQISVHPVPCSDLLAVLCRTRTVLNVSAWSSAFSKLVSHVTCMYIFVWGLMGQEEGLCTAGLYLANCARRDGVMFSNVTSEDECK
jgi:hypothetical protein